MEKREIDWSAYSHLDQQFVAAAKNTFQRFGPALQALADGPWTDEDDDDGDDSDPTTEFD